MENKSHSEKFNIEFIIFLKVLLGYVFVMSEYVSRRMNVYIGFFMIVLVSSISWFTFMVYDFENYQWFEVLNSICINIPLCVLCVLGILTFKTQSMARHRYPICAAALLFCFVIGVYFCVMNLLFMGNYSNQNIAIWGLVTNFFRAFGGMFLFLTLLDDNNI